MIKSKEQKAVLYRKSGGLDIYGQETDEKERIAEITGSLLEYERQINHTSPVYEEVTKVFLTDYKDITSDCLLEIGETLYPVKYAPDHARKKVVYLGNPD